MLLSVPKSESNMNILQGFG